MNDAYCAECIVAEKHLLAVTIYRGTALCSGHVREQIAMVSDALAKFREHKA